MAYQKCGGGSSLYDMVKTAQVRNAGTGSTNQTFSATSGKRYLVVAVRYSSSTTPGDAGISSGATVDTVFLNNVTNTNSRLKIYAAIVTATSSTVTMLGTANGACFMPLD